MSAHPNQFSLGDILLDSPDASRVVTNATGVDDSAVLRVSLEERAQQDGLWDADTFYGGRVVQLEGYCMEASPQEAHGLLAQMRALGRRPVPLTVASAGRGTLNATVRIQAGVEAQWFDEQSFSYTITCVATDPLLYGPERFAPTGLVGSAGGAGLAYPLAYPLDYGVPPGVIPGGITVANAGTVSYFPRLRIGGPVTNPVVGLAETGDTIRYNGTVAAGQHVDINWGVPRRVTIGDNPIPARRNITAVGNWLAVPVGGATVTFSADDANPAATLTVWSYEGAWE